MTAMTAVSTTREVSTALHGAHRGDAQRKLSMKGYRADQIIVMGLPKTGTTATANALVDVGYNVSHNAGDKLRPRCQVIVNTLESSYPELDRKHPNAKWLILYTTTMPRGGWIPCKHTLNVLPVAGLRVCPATLTDVRWALLMGYESRSFSTLQQGLRKKATSFQRRQTWSCWQLIACITNGCSRTSRADRMPWLMCGKVNT